MIINLLHSTSTSALSQAATLPKIILRSGDHHDPSRQNGIFELIAQLALATAQELEKIQEEQEVEQEEEQVSSQAIETIVVTTRSGQKRKDTEKFKDKKAQQVHRRGEKV